MPDPPRTALADSALARHRLLEHARQIEQSGEEGDSAAGPASLPAYQPIQNGTVLPFDNHADLIHAFRRIPADNRGYLHNASPDAGRRRIRPEHTRMPSPLEGMIDFVSDLFEAPDFHTFLIEQTSLGRAIAEGYGAARRSTTSSPPGPDAEGHVPAAGMRRGAGMNAIGAFLDYSHSISISIRDRAHHAVIIVTPPDGSDFEAYHCVLMRPLLPSMMLGDWMLVSASAARSFLRD
ncbi:hypothetical protein Enr13x_24570 [Stieleria neptunia]|uniref:Uncharacterized protein n=1 Tax=Stieleria neptunia TaxID=2527979 RepID=A0A518HP38_9BACT|nr:hypothetical protein [Stieleria neptunia]QDV42608.1 hypothetical protein Enr13x_24570 [Stieleria neptunia]